MTEKVVDLKGKPIAPGGGRKKGYKNTPFTIEKIKQTQLVNRAFKIAMGEIDATPSQTRALMGLLSKFAPDMKSSEVTVNQPDVVMIDTGIRRTGTSDE